MNLNGRGAGEDFGGVEGEENIISIYYVKKVYFNRERERDCQNKRPIKVRVTEEEAIHQKGPKKDGNRKLKPPHRTYMTS